MIFRWLLLALAALVLVFGAVWIGAERGDFSQWIWATITYSIIGGGLVLAAAWTWRQQNVGRTWLLVVVLLGVFMRLAIMPSTRELSDDAARYHWDGKAVAHGINPYLYPPDDPAVARLWTDDVDERINHPWNRTCYPPVAQVYFTTAYRLSPGNLRGLQWLALISEIVAWFILAQAFVARGRNRSWLLLMIWSPLIICQGYLPGHLDGFMLPFVALTISAVLSRNSARAGIWLAIACLIKPLPLLILPAIMREVGWRRSAVMLAVFGAVVGIAYLPFRDAGYNLFQSTWLMATDWSFNGSVSALLESQMAKRPAHLIAAFLTGLGILLAAWRGRDFFARAVGAYIVFAVFTPTIFPWYLISALPLLVWRPQWALLLLLLFLPLSDQVVIQHHLHDEWREAAWVRWVQYLPFYGALIWLFVSSNWRRRPRSTTGA